MSDREQPASGETADTAALLLPLGRLGRGDLAAAGGKGANLGELVRAGFPVPPGFVLTTTAYDRFVAHNHLGDVIARALREGQGSGAAVRDAFEGAPIPPDIGQTLQTAYDQLGRGPVAVRSSATAEDLPEAAFAGQQDTFLNTVGPDALRDAVRRCWASLWSDRAIAYRRRQHLDRQKVKIAVVVQRMAAAAAAGVMFTANPVTGARDETVIDASPGLGEAVVSGRVTPDHFVLRRRWWGWRIVERRPGRREMVIRPRAAGGTEEVSPDAAAASRPALPDGAVRRLARLGAAIARHFGGPQDVEWAWTGAAFAIVQARPITALPPPVSPLTPWRRAAAAMAAELLPSRPYPLDMTAWGPAMYAALARMASPLGLAAAPFDQIFVEQDGVVVRFSGKWPLHPTQGVLLAPLRLLLLCGRYDPLRWQADPLLAETLDRARALETRDPKALSWEGLLAALREALTTLLPVIGEVRRRYFPRAAVAAGLLRVALGLLGRGNRFGALLSGAETKTLQANRALEDLATRIRSDPAVAAVFAGREAGELEAALREQPAGRTFLAELRAFLDHYGHREALITTISRPTWQDAPAVVLGILTGLAAAPPHSRTARPAWEAARDEVLTHPLLRLPPLRAAFLGLLAPARCLLQIREDTHFYATLCLPIIRRIVFELGRRLVGVGALDVPEDVFHLRLRELEQVDGAWPPPPRLAEQLRDLAARRKQRRAALEGTPLVDPRWLRRREVEGDVLLRGTPGSPGTAEGPVRVVRDGSEFGKLRAGEVLIAPFTNPAWTPLFQRAAAVVVDSGGAASHAAIVAREYGIPAVMATIDGTRRLADGRRVRVDGDRGVVLAARPLPP